MAMKTNNLCELNIMCYNLHGFYQGFSVINDSIASDKPHVFLLQEHWLTPSNLSLFDSSFPGYFSFGSSAMSKSVEAGMLRGRPFGGVMILIRDDLRTLTETIYCEERFAILRVANYLIATVYLPCVGYNDRYLLCEEILCTISAWRARYSELEFLLAGDFNVNLDKSDDHIANLVSNFMRTFHLSRCDDLYPNQKVPTYVNLALRHESQIDFILVSKPSYVTDFHVLDPSINFSDHVPLLVTTKCLNVSKAKSKSTSSSNHVKFNLTQLRWDKGDKDSFYYYTGHNLLPLIDVVDNMLSTYEAGTVPTDSVHNCIESTYASILSTLSSAGDMYIPKCHKNFFKFWWDEDLSLAKQASIDSDRIWKDAGKPRSGPIFSERQSCRLQYRQRLRQAQRMNDNMYSNDLHEALLKKNGTSFWKCWRSKFETSNKCKQVDGCVDADTIADKFRSYFTNVFTCNNNDKAESLKNEFLQVYNSYCGLPMTDDHRFDTELVSSIIGNLKHGKAADIDSLCAEHLFFSHPAISILLTKLFQLMLSSSYIPVGFRYNYIVPVIKPKEFHSKSLTCNDFRAIAISPILSKVFEHCILDRFNLFFQTSDNQFGFKKGVGCSFAIRAVRNIVDNYLNGRSTTNLCAIDLSKAFDKVNHHALFLKLIKRLIPKQLLNLLVSWLSGCYTCVKWYHAWSQMFSVTFGVRQGSVLSPYLFAIYMDDLAKLCQYKCGMYIVLYADDILLLAPCVSKLQQLLTLCEAELDSLDMLINVQKSCCLRIGPRSHVSCAPITCTSGAALPWVDEVRYLGVFMKRSRVFKCSLDHAKKGFYRAANAIFGKVGRIASEEVVLQLIISKCIPILLYGLEACPLVKSDLAALDFVINRFFMKLFKTNNIDIVKSCQLHFNFDIPSALWVKRVKRFNEKFSATNNTFCKITESSRVHVMFV